MNLVDDIHPIVREKLNEIMKKENEMLKEINNEVIEEQTEDDFE